MCFFGAAEFEGELDRFMHEDSMDVKMHAYWVHAPNDTCMECIKIGVLIFKFSMCPFGQKR